MPLPPDTVSLPLTEGVLLVSRGHAVFCHVTEAEAEVVRQGGALPESLASNLERHGFLGPPRPPPPASPTVQLQVTNACNLACAWCCTHSGEARPREVDFAALSALIADLPRVMGPSTRVALLGGEPLSVPWTPDLADRVLDAGLFVTIFTNGVPLADPALARRVAGCVDRGAVLRVSLASASAVSCDDLSGNPRFEDAVRGVNLVCEALDGRVKGVFVDLMLAPQNVDDIVQHLPALRRRLPRALAVSVGILFQGGRETGAHLFPTAAALEAALDRVAFEAGEVVPAEPRGSVAFRRDGCACTQGHHLHVRSDGTLFPCFRMEEAAGHLDDGFEAALLRLRAAARPASVLPTCRDCVLATLCGGGCASDNLFHTGRADTPWCGPWRIRVLCELLAEDRPGAVEWPAARLWEEARGRGIPAPETVPRVRGSLHLG